MALRADAMHFAGWLGVPPSSREDIVQTALVRVFPHAASLDKPSSLKAYLFATVRNLWRNECRRRRGSPTSTSGFEQVEVAESAPGPAELMVQATDEASVRTAFEALRSEQRDLIRMRFIEALEHGAVARRLGLSNAAV